MPAYESSQVIDVYSEIEESLEQNITPILSKA